MYIFIKVKFDFLKSPKFHIKIENQKNSLKLHIVKL